MSEESRCAESKLCQVKSDDVQTETTCTEGVAVVSPQRVPSNMKALHVRSSTHGHIACLQDPEYAALSALFFLDYHEAVKQCCNSDEDAFVQLCLR